MGGIVDETYARVQSIITTCILTLLEVGVHLIEAVGRIIIIGGGVVDGGLTDARVPIAVPSGNEGHIAEVAWVGHSVLLILQNLVDDGRDLVGVFGRHTAVEHVGEIVVVNRTIVEVGYLLCGGATGFSRDLACVADKDNESRCCALADASVVEVLHVGLNGVIVAAGLCCGHYIHVKTFLYLPVDPRLQGGDVVFGRDDNHVDGIGHQVRVVGVDIKDLAVVEHLLVNDVEIRAVGTEQHTLGLGVVGSIEADFHLNVVEHAESVGGRVIAHGIDDQRADADATHGALHFNSGFRSRGKAAGLIGLSVVDELHLIRVLVLADRRLMGKDGADTVVGKAIIRCRVIDDTNARRGPKRHGQQLVRGGQLGRTHLA